MFLFLAFFIFCPVFFVVLLYLVDLVKHRNHLVGGKGNWLPYLSSVCGLCTVCYVKLLFYFMSLVGYDL